MSKLHYHPNKERGLALKPCRDYLYDTNYVQDNSQRSYSEGRSKYQNLSGLLQNNLSD